MILAIHHVQITIPKGSVEAAGQFYCEFLGLKEIEKPENRKEKGGFWLQLGECQIHIGDVAYLVNDLSLWRKRILEKGIEIAESLPFSNARAFEFRDPFGNRVELIQHSNN